MKVLTLTLVIPMPVEIEVNTVPHFKATVQIIAALPNSILCTNWLKITMLFYYLKVPKDFSPLYPTLTLTGALKWGTVWTSTSNGCC